MKQANQDETEEECWKLSFLVGQLLRREAQIAVPIFLETQDWHETSERIKANHLFQHQTASSERRYLQELVSRLSTLSLQELTYFASASFTEQGYLLWLAACRQYAFIYEFAEEVIREKFLVMSPQLTHADFDVFVRSNAPWHPELNNIKDSTLGKLRQNLFKMIEEAGLTSNGYITQIFFSQGLRDILSTKTPSETHLFPTPNSDTVKLVEA